MRNVVINLFVFVALVAFTTVSCSSGFPGFDKTKTGLYYKIYKLSDDTAKAKTGDFVTMHMWYTTAGDSTLFNSKEGGNPISFRLPPSDFPGDIYEGISMLSEGDSGIFIISADSLFLKSFRQPRPPYIDSASVIKFHIHLVSAETTEELQAKEVQVISKYLADNGISTQPQSSGLYYIEQLAGTGNAIDTGDMVNLHFTVSLPGGAPIFSTFQRGQPVEMKFGRRFENPGFDEGVSLMKKGGKAKFIVPSNLAFGENGRPGTIPPFSPVVYEVEIVEITPGAVYEKQQAEAKMKEEMLKEKGKNEELVKLNAYIKEKNITTKPRPSGLYYIENQKGTGAKAESGKKVKVHYTGTLLDGTKFDSSLDRDQPFEFVLGQGQVIPGWDEGIGLMDVGGKARLIIPSVIAYGDRNMGTITPYSTLVFDVELISVE
jgi:FKBP-type peptidyl-prolyl cis-trans isomerase